jgi:hypothetical protein
LQFYGHGMLATRSMELVDLGFDERLNVGSTKFHVVTELLREKLPPQARGVQVNSPEDLRREGDLELEWQRVGGQWYYLMDDEVVSGQAGGQPIVPGPTGSNQNPR